MESVLTLISVLVLGLAAVGTAGQHTGANPFAGSADVIFTSGLGDVLTLAGSILGLG